MTRRFPGSDVLLKARAAANRTGTKLLICFGGLRLLSRKSACQNFSNRKMHCYSCCGHIRTRARARMRACTDSHSHTRTLAPTPARRAHSGNSRSNGFSQMVASKRIRCLLMLPSPAAPIARLPGGAGLAIRAATRASCRTRGPTGVSLSALAPRAAGSGSHAAAIARSRAHAARRQGPVRPEPRQAVRRERVRAAAAARASCPRASARQRCRPTERARPHDRGRTHEHGASS